MPSIERYQQFIRRNALGAQYGLEKRTLYFLIEAAEFANEVKRIESKDGGDITYDRHYKLVEELGDTLYYFFLLMDELNVSLEDVMYRNIKKLEERFGERTAECLKDSNFYSPVPDVPTSN